MGYNLSDEERERRRQLARELHAQVDPDTGRRRFGGSQPGSGRPRKVRAAELVAEEAQKEARNIAKVLKEAIEPNQPITVRVAAAKQWIEIENKEAELQLKEDRELRDLSHEELVARVSAMFITLQDSGQLDPELSSITGQEVVNGTVRELTSGDNGD